MRETKLALSTLLALILATAPVAAQDEAPPEEPAPMEDSAAAETPDPPDPRAEDRAAILELIERERQAYLDENAEAIVALYADEVVSVAGGQVFTASREELQASLESTLEQVDYLEVETLGSPVVRFSPDGRMAWVAVRQRIRRTMRTSESQVNEAELVFAGAYTYEKQDPGWVKTSSASTFGRK